jgi:hypothetical protein
MALLEANYFRVLGCEFEADKANCDFNEHSKTSTPPGSWLDFFAVDKDSFNDYGQVEDSLVSTTTSLDKNAGIIHVSQLLVSLDVVMSK